MKSLTLWANRSLVLIFSVLISIFFLLDLPKAYADLEVANVLSVQWLADSSDVIYFIKFRKDKKNSPKVQFFYDLKKGKEKGAHLSITELQKTIQKNVWLSPKVNEEWIFFARKRTTHSKDVRIFRGINLTTPLKSYRTAAITQEGKLLSNRQTILAAISTRIQQKNSLPPKVNRQAIDNLIKTYKPEWKNISVGNLNHLLGGTLVKIKCDYWDSPGPNNQGTVITQVVTPVRAEEHDKILKAIQGGEKSLTQSKFVYPILTLVNFPGEKTEASLRAFIEKNKNRHASSSSLLRAQAVLLYLNYHLQPAAPQNRLLVGRWRLKGHHEWIDFTFTADQTFIANAFSPPKNEREKPQHLWDGQGYWKIQDKKLSLMRTHHREGLHWVKRNREFFRAKKIEKITSEKIILEGGSPMIRQNI